MPPALVDAIRRRGTKRPGLNLESRDERNPCRQTAISNVSNRSTQNERFSPIWMYVTGSSSPIFIFAGRIVCSLGNYGILAEVNSKEKSTMCNMTTLSQSRPFAASIIVIAR